GDRKAGGVRGHRERIGLPGIYDGGGGAEVGVCGRAAGAHVDRVEGHVHDARGIVATGRGRAIAGRAVRDRCDRDGATGAGVAGAGDEHTVPRGDRCACYLRGRGAQAVVGEGASGPAGAALPLVAEPDVRGWILDIQGEVRIETRGDVRARG